MVPLPVIGSALQWLTPVMLDGVAGILAGALVLAVVSGARRVTHPATGC
jgi:predicted DNA repair protein MutK